MSWKVHIRSHKARLAIVSACAAGVILAVVFALVFLWAQARIDRHHRTTLRAAVNLAITDPEPDEVSEISSSYPQLSIREFTNMGIRRQAGRLNLLRLTGFYYGKQTLQYGVDSPHGTVVVGMSLIDSTNGLFQLAVVLAVLWLPLTLMGAGVTWYTANSVFKPLDRISQEAAAISGKHLHERLATEDRAEFGVLTRQLNEMLERIEDGVTREEQFAADAAHELRTPLSILQTRIETTLLKPRKASEYVESLEMLLNEVGHVINLAEALLMTAGPVEAEVEASDLAVVVDGALAKWHANSRNGVQVTGESVCVYAPVHPEEFRIIIDNLVENAMRYSPEGGTIHVDLAPLAGRAILTVSDEGPGVPPELGDLVFERFVRADKSRNRESGGFGIGLALVRRLVVARGGTISVTNKESGGAVFRVDLPSGKPPVAIA